MKITLDEAAKEKLSAHLDSNKQLLLTFEDGVGPYSQHANTVFDQYYFS